LAQASWLNESCLCLEHFGMFFDSMLESNCDKYD
jgi:hypothetical protein